MKRFSAVALALSFLVLVGCASPQTLGPNADIFRLGPKRVVMPPLAPVSALGGKVVMMRYNPREFCPDWSRSDDKAVVAPILERHMSARDAGVAQEGKRRLVLFSSLRRERKQVQETPRDLDAVVCLSRISEYHQNIYGYGDHRYTAVVSVRVLDKNQRVVAYGHSQFSFWQHDEAAWSESFIRAAEIASRTMKSAPR